MSIQQGYFNRVKYTLHHNTLGSQIIEEPEGWKDDEKEFARHERYHGIFPSFSNSSKYYGNGYYFLKTVYEIDGINANVRLTKDVKNPYTDEWEREYSGFIDFSTYTEEDKKISLKFNSDGLQEILLARESEEIEIERETDLEGNLLPNLKTAKINLSGRKIFLKSEWGKNPDVTNIDFDSTGSKTIPLTISRQEQEEAQSIVDFSMLGSNPLDSGDMFFLDSQTDYERTIRLKFKLDVLYKFYFYNNRVNWDLTNFKVRLIKYSSGIDFDNPTIISEDTLSYMYEGYSDINAFHDISYELNQTIQINKGESLSLQFYYNQVNIVSPSDAGLQLIMVNADMYIEEDSYYPPTQTKTILAHELYERVVNILTGKNNAVKSNALGRTDIGYYETGTNTGALTGLSHGMWIREFDRLPNNDDNKYKPFKTSFRDLHESFANVFGLGIGIDKKGNTERLRVEQLSYFYNRNTTIKLPNQVKKVKRTISTDYFFSALEIGYEKGGKYDEAQGLDEYNAKSNYISAITRIRNPLNMVSSYRADMYGAEFARRKNKEKFNNVDTSYDQDVFMFDIKPVFTSMNGYQSLYNQRYWQDDFEIEPTGVYDPESATNLRLSPANNLLRNSWWLKAGLVKYPDTYLRFGSSTGNSKLTTKRINKPEISENKDIPVTFLDRPIFVPEIIEFEHVVDFDTVKKLNGTSVILGQEIMNVYGCIEFINENNEIEKGFLLSVKPNGKGQWKLLKTY